jgi:hypothetical protein
MACRQWVRLRQTALRRQAAQIRSEAPFAFGEALFSFFMTGVHFRRQCRVLVILGFCWRCTYQLLQRCDARQNDVA